MQNSICLAVVVLGSLAVFSDAALSGPYLLWGHKKVLELQPSALEESNKDGFVQLFRDAKSILVFMRNQTKLTGIKYPKLQSLLKNEKWTYLPQRDLPTEPFKYNENIEIVNLSDAQSAADEQLITSYNEAVTIYGEDAVLGILAQHAQEAHYLAKREAKKAEDTTLSFSTTETTPAAAEETEESFIYLADGKKAILYVNSAPELNISHTNESIKLVEHNKAITFDDQRKKGYGRLNIIFNVNGEKLFLRFNFTLYTGNWAMKAVELEYKEYKTVLPVVGNAYTVPSAPMGFSYRCSAEKLIFTNRNDSLVINDYQVQPWLNGSSKFGRVSDCVGLTTAPIWSGVLISLFLCGVISIGIIAILEIKPPNRFESSRSKQLTFTVQE